MTKPFDPEQPDFGVSPTRSNDPNGPAPDDPGKTGDIEPPETGGNAAPIGKPPSYRWVWGLALVAVLAALILVVAGIGGGYIGFAPAENKDQQAADKDQKKKKREQELAKKKREQELEKEKEKKKKEDQAKHIGDIQTAFDEAKKLREKLVGELRQSGGVFRMLDQPGQWLERISAARKSLQAASEKATLVELLHPEIVIDAAILKNIASLETDLKHDDAQRLRALQLANIRLAAVLFLQSESPQDIPTEREYDKVFSQAGVTAMKGGAAEIAEQIKTYDIRELLAASLDHWAVTLSIKKKTDDSKRLLEIARLADPDKFRNQWREVLLNQDWNTLENLAAASEAGAQPAHVLCLITDQLQAHGNGGEKTLQKALANRVNDFWLNYQMAGLLSKTNPIQAKEYLDKALAGRPNNDLLRIRAGDLLRNQKKVDEAILAYEEVRNSDPKNAMALLHLGDALAVKRKVPEAVELYNQVLAGDPKNVQALRLLGQALRMKNDLNGALARFRQVIKLEPTHVQAVNLIGMIFVQQKNIDAALAQFLEATQLDPKYAIAWNNVGYAKFVKKDLEGAEKALRKAISIDAKFSRPYVHLANVLKTKNDLPGATTALQNAVNLNDKDVQAHFELGRILQKQKKLPEAANSYEKVLKLNPKILTAQSALADIWQLQGQKAKAAKAHASVGALLLKQNDVQKAAEALRKAVAADPALVTAQVNLGLALYQLKDAQGAKSALETALKLDPKMGMAHGFLGMTSLDDGEFTKAAASIGKALDLLPPKDRLRKVFEAQQKRCQQLIALEKQLPKAAKDKDAPANVLMSLAVLCQRFKKHYHTATRFYVRAFDKEPKLSANPGLLHRYNAARTAVLAAAGKGKEKAKLTGKEQTELRKQALQWLQADFAVWNKLAQDVRNPMKLIAVESVLDMWLREADLAGVRAGKNVTELPKEEQQSWKKFWSELVQLRKKVGSAFTTKILKGKMSQARSEQVVPLKMTANKTYIIEMKSKQFDTFLRLHDSKGKKLKENDDIDLKRRNLNSRIVFTPKQDGIYRIIATSYQRSGQGAFQIVIREFHSSEL